MPVLTQKKKKHAEMQELETVLKNKSREQRLLLSGIRQLIWQRRILKENIIKVSKKGEEIILLSSQQIVKVNTKLKLRETTKKKF